MTLITFSPELTELGQLLGPFGEWGTRGVTSQPHMR
jgi:hypothetical protein